MLQGEVLILQEGRGSAMTCAHGPNRSTHAFSLIEIVLVIVIMGIVAAIAVPRMSSAASRSRVTALRADLAAMNRATEFYMAEHGGRHPAQDKAGAIADSSTEFAARLAERTDEFGSPGSLYGPYLLRIPTNPLNGLSSVRVDGPPAGAGTHGWRFDTATQTFAPDDSAVTAAIALDGGSAVAVETGADGQAKMLGGLKAVDLGGGK
jgi:prepilin-type N-terminal cleavage/methylation domain-containing protein